MGYKRSDRRWVDDEGTVWASKFEYKVFAGLRDSGCNVRKCTGSDTFSYTEHKPNVRCVECGGCDCVQDRTYTPDLFYTPEQGEGSGTGYYIETKGYFAAPKRSLFRSLRASRPDIDLRVVLESDGWVTKGKTRLTDYFSRYLKTTPVHVWDGDIPEEWK